MDVRQAEQLVLGARRRSSICSGCIEQQENLLSVLLGRNPGPIARGRALTEQPHAPDVPAGLPSALLERRPDIQQAEQEMVAANARDRRGEGGVLSADHADRIRRRREHGAVGAVHRTGGAWAVGRRPSCSRSSTPAARDRRWRSPRRGARRRSSPTSRRSSRRFAKCPTRWSAIAALREFRETQEQLVRRGAGRAAPRRPALSGRRDQLPRGARQRHAAVQRGARPRAGAAERAGRVRRDLSRARRRLEVLSERRT